MRWRYILGRSDPPSRLEIYPYRHALRVAYNQATNPFTRLRSCGGLLFCFHIVYLPPRRFCENRLHKNSSSYKYVEDKNKIILFSFVEDEEIEREAGGGDMK